MTTETARQDGRRQRAERSQQAVVAALLDLYRAGNLRPSAQEIAARSGVSERTVFRLFDDLEALAALAMQRQWARVGHLFEPPDDSGDRRERIAALVAQRLALFAEIATVSRVARLRAPFSPALREGVEWRDRRLRDQLPQQFAAELAPLPPAEREELLSALDAATSIETMELLHGAQGRPLDEVSRVLGRTVRALLADAETRERTMRTLRTPDERFANLPGFPYAPHYVTIDDGEGGRLRVHYLDEGPRDAPVVLLMHGEPSWCYLYRTMIPVLTAAGLRCVAPDLVGFGRSDKPAARGDYTYARHVQWMRAALLDALDLRGITFFGQDWGGLIGLRLLTAEPDRFDRAVVANTGLPTGDGPMSEAFQRWQRFSQESPVFHIGGIVKGGCATPLSPDVVAAYDAPFPDESYKEGARAFPLLVPTRPDDPEAPANRAAWQVLSRWQKPLLCAFSDSDPVTAGGERVFKARVPGAQGQPHTTIASAGHFLQEDKGPELARVVAAFVGATSG